MTTRTTYLITTQHPAPEFCLRDHPIEAVESDGVMYFKSAKLGCSRDYRCDLNRAINAFVAEHGMRLINMEPVAEEWRAALDKHHNDYMAELDAADAADADAHTKARKVQAGWYAVQIAEREEVLGDGAAKLRWKDELTLDIRKEGRGMFSTWDVTYRTGFERSDRNCIACFDKLANAKAFAIAAAKAARAGEAMPNPAAFEEGSSSHCAAWNDVILPLTAELAA